MSFFPARMEQAVNTLSNYAVLKSPIITPALGTAPFTLDQTLMRDHSFIPTEAFIVCAVAPAGSLVQTTFNLGWNAASGYTEFISGETFGSNAGVASLQMVQRKFKQMKLVATSSSGAGYAASNSYGVMPFIRLNQTAVLGAVTTERFFFYICGFYTGLK